MSKEENSFTSTEIGDLHEEGIIFLYKYKPSITLAPTSTSLNEFELDAPKKSSASSLLRFSGSWKGNDLTERLDEVYLTRSTADDE